jgi:4-amino-4-deoxy-L-arabinose transferase-like glycosyltransferase
VNQVLNRRGLGKVGFKAWLSSHFALLSILFGSALFSFTAGPFQNWDTGLEFQAASAVMKYGVPFNANAGTMFNQPPMGFYIDSLAFRIFGLSINTGVAVVTCFGLGCTVLVYLIGKAWYGKLTGLVASAIFAVTPWQVILSRSFLIDAQCLFFSLLFLLIGYYAIRKNSLWLFTLSGVFFGVALMTKLFAILMLFPLAILYFHYKPKKLWNPLPVLYFSLPVIVLLQIWYHDVLRCNILTIFWQDDFKNYNSPASMPSGFFTLNFLLGALGAFFLAAVIISLLVSSFQTKLFRNVLTADLTCLATIILVVGLDTFLGWGLNFSAPFTSAVKYDYQALPFLCLLAGSVLTKCQRLFKALETKLSRGKLLFGAACLGVACLAIAVASNLSDVNLYSRLDTVAFNVQGTVSYGFSNSSKLVESNGLIYLQYAGFALLILGLIWAVKENLIKPKSAAE